MRGRAGVISFRYNLGTHGWADATITDGLATAHLTASYAAPDPLRDLTDATVALLQGEQEAGFSWLEEPEVDDWWLRRRDAVITVSVVRFRSGSLFRPRTEERGELVFEGACTVGEFAAQVLHELERLLDEFGVEGYNRRWHGDRVRPESDFPVESYERLRTLLGRPSRLRA